MGLVAPETGAARPFVVVEPETGVPWRNVSAAAPVKDVGRTDMGSADRSLLVVPLPARDLRTHARMTPVTARSARAVVPREIGGEDELFSLVGWATI
jgi:hypothetical protein